MLLFVLGYVYGHVLEYFLHRFVLHSKVGVKRGHFLSFHFSEHHSSARKNDFVDLSYKDGLLRWNAASKEAVALTLLMLIHIPFFYLSKYFFAALLVSLVEYYYKHRRAHSDVNWAKSNIPWHYDHHMGPDQHKNWGVRSDIVDKIFKTKERYI